jgi:hypothetical protein
MTAVVLLLLSVAARATDVTSAWTGTRWHIEIEETTPAPLELAAIEDASFQTRAVQVSGVFSCPTVRTFGKAKAEVRCVVDDLAMRATPRTVDQPTTVTASNNAVLADLVQRMRGATVLVTVTDDGRVETVALEGVPDTNRRESEQAEVLRRLMFDVFAGFHLRRDAGWKAGWSEKASQLLRAPTQPQGMGSTRMDHAVSAIEGSTVVQSSGKGTFTSVYEPWEPAVANPSGSAARRAGAAGAQPTAGDANAQLSPTGTQAVPTDRTFEGSITSVAVVDSDTGWPTERVWAMLASPTASSVGSLQGTSIWYAGRLSRIQAGEKVDLGATQVVSPPKIHVDGLPDWDPLETI